MRVERPLGRAVIVHPYAWLWEPLELEASFVLRAMFGTKVVYLDGKLMLCFAAKAEPWRGVLVCTDRSAHESLQGELPELVPHPILPKWLYLPESDNSFERVAERLVRLAKARDNRLGVVAKEKKRKRASRKSKPGRARKRKNSDR